MTTTNTNNDTPAKLDKSTASGGEFPKGQMGTRKKKPATKAWLKVQEERVTMNQDRACIIADNYSCVVFVYLSANGKPCAVGYKGRAKKPVFHYSYKTIEARELKVNEWMEELSNAVKEKTSIERRLNVGDILYSSWGWEQTNIDFYKVIGLKGGLSVELVEIAGNRDYDGDMSGKTSPMINELVGEAFTRRVCCDGATVRISSFQSASLNDFTEESGNKIYKSHYFSTYA